MMRYVGPFVAVSLLTLTGCLTYPYGNYLGYGGYGDYGGFGGYPYNNYPYSSSAPYCPPSYGYSYDPYAGNYGYGYGYSPGVVIPSPAPPVVVEDNIYSYDNHRYTSGRRWQRQRQHARDGYRNHFPGTDDPLSGGPAAGPERTRDGRQAAAEWIRQQSANRSAQTVNSGILPGNFNSYRRGKSSGTAGPQSSGAGTWQAGQNRQFVNRNQARMPVGPNLGAPSGSTPIRRCGGVLCCNSEGRLQGPG